MDIESLASQFRSQLQKIKVCAFDVDGILTDGNVWWAGEEIGWNRQTNTQDGYGFHLLMDAGIKVGIITGGDSLSITKRFEENLKLDFIFKGSDDKRKAFSSILEMGHSPEEVLYMGDELFDIPLLKKAGFSATVPNAVLEVRQVVDYITQKESGKGCAREVIEILRWVQKIKPIIPDFES